MIKKLWQLIVTIVLCGSFWGLGFAPVWATVSPDLERNILEVIQKHPDASIQSVSAYQRQQQEQQAQAREKVLAQVKQQLPQVIGMSPVLGDRNASVTVIEFADFECTYCRKVHPDLKSLHQRYPQVAFVFKHLPITNLHPEAIPAATATWAAQQQGKFWEFHDALFETKQPLGEATYRTIAQRLKLNLEQFEGDRQSPQAQEAIRQDMFWSETLRIEGTPFFLIATPERVEAVSGADMRFIETVVSRAIG
ncbi:MAG: thioredoxin domain-containing protein [Leptolyngbyaceae cyanobacterium bins.59]|nr:thioredoxin domain-containing protein [Leptolyngbyaceae cyanobacterium bins.59]